MKKERGPKKYQTEYKEKKSKRTYNGIKIKKNPEKRTKKTQKPKKKKRGTKGLKKEGIKYEENIILKMDIDQEKMKREKHQMRRKRDDKVQITRK